MRTLFCFCLAAALVGPAQAQWAVQAPATSAGPQREPALALAADGRAVVAWTSAPDADAPSTVRWRLFDGETPASPETAADPDAPLAQFQPAVALAGDGAFVVAWTAHVDTSMLDVFARRFGADGAPAGPAFRVNVTTALSQAAPDIAVDGTGTFTIVWHTWGQDGGDRAVVLRRYAADGTPLTGEVQVNTVTAYSQAYPSIAAAPDGRAVVAWASWTDDAPGVFSYDVRARFFDAGGQPLGDDVLVNTQQDGDQWHADAAMNAAGEAVVAWTSWGEDGDDGGVYARRYAADGTPDGAPWRLNTVTAGYQWLPSVALADDGRVAAAWSSFDQDGSREGVFYQVFAPGGAVEPGLRANGVTAGYQWEPALAWRGDAMAVAWSSWGQDGDDYGVFVRSFAETQVRTEPEGAPTGVLLMPGYPNPSRSDVTLRYRLDRPTSVRLELVDLLGREAQVLASGVQPAGWHAAVWDGRARSGRRGAPGIYLVRLTTPDRVVSRHVVLVD